MNDADIIELFFNRSEGAIKALEEKYDRQARSVAMNILGDSQDAEECMNDSYFGMWNSIPPERPEVLPAYFTAVTRNTALKLYRKRRASKRTVIMEELTDMTSGVTLFEDDVDRVSVIINGFLAKQDKRARVLFMRRYYFGDSIPEAAKAVGMTVNGATVKLSRMRARLKKELESEGIIV